MQSFKKIQAYNRENANTNVFVHAIGNCAISAASMGMRSPLPVDFSITKGFSL